MALASFAAAAAFAAVAFWRGLAAFPGSDTDAYVGAARAILRGQDPYTVTTTAGVFGFIYPPFAALVFLPFVPLPDHVATALWQTLTLAALFPLTWLVLRAARVEVAHRRLWPVVALGLIAWYPVTRNLIAGQVDLVLVLLVAVDFFLLRGTRWHGVLIGIAAGIKLTPAAYLLTFLVGREWRRLFTAAAAGAATVLVGVLVAPGDSLRYWTHLGEETSKSGTPAQALSQCWDSLVMRLTNDGSGVLRPPWTLVWLVLVLATVVAGGVVIRSLLSRGALVAAVGTNAVVNLLVSPLSTMHHWVAALPLFVALAVLAIRGRKPLVGAWVALGALLSGVPSWWYLGTSATWGPWQSLVGSALVFWAAATLLILFVQRDALAHALGRRPARPVRAVQTGL